jgi:hypothetical protein
MVPGRHARIPPMRGMIIYCERAGDAVWAEPLNALSGLVFVLAAVAAWRVYRGLRPPADGSRRWDLVLLVVLMAAVGIGSFLWHTLGTPWAEWADVIPILMFMNLYLVSFLYRGAGLGTFGVLVLLLAFQWAMAVAWTRLSAGFINGSAFYLPAMFALWLLALYSAARIGKQAWPAIAAAALFTGSLALLSLDLTVCPLFPPGTHFLWHLLNVLIAYLMFLGLVRLINNNARQGGAGPIRRRVTAPS